MESANTGLVDGIGGDSDAIEKAAQLAGVSNYGLVDVNTEVFRAFNQRFKRIIEPLQSGGDGGEWPAASGQWPVDTLRRYMLPSGLGGEQERALPGFPMKVNGPNVYYLYVGPSE